MPQLDPFSIIFYIDDLLIIFLSTYFIIYIYFMISNITILNITYLSDAELLIF